MVSTALMVGEDINKIIQKLKGGDLRSIGKSDEVVKDILNDPCLFVDVFQGMLDDDPVVRMRSADALEKVSSKRSELLQPFKAILINEVSNVEQQEVRWHVAQMFSYLKTDKKEKDKIIRILFSWLDTEKSNIVKVFSMQTLAELAEKDKKIKPMVVKKIEKTMRSGTPSIVGRGKKLLKKLK